MSDLASQASGAGYGALLSQAETATGSAKWDAERKRERAAHARRMRKEQAQQRRMAALEAALRTSGLTGHADVLTAARAYLRFLEAAPSPEDAA